MAATQSPTETGRGTIVGEGIASAPATAPSITFTVPDNIAITAGSGIILIVVPVGGSGSSRTIGITNNFDPSGSTNVQIGTETGATAAATIATGVNSNASFVASNNGAVVTIAGVATGVTTAAFTITNTGITNPLTDIIEFLGSDPVNLILPDFSFEGPFTDINPEGDPLQGFTRMAIIFNTFMSSLSTVTNNTGIITAFTTLKDSLESGFPQSFASEGIIRDASALGKITLRGTRRDPNGLIGRGRRDIRYPFTNVVSDFGLRQVILRIFDSVADLFLLLSDSSLSAATVASDATAALQRLDVDFLEIEEAMGDMGPQVYENTIVSASSDQGFLIYSDELALRPVRLVGSTRVAIATATAGIEKLRLKN